MTSARRPRPHAKARFQAAQARAFKVATSAVASRGVELVAPTGSMQGPRPAWMTGRGLSLAPAKERREAAPVRLGEVVNVNRMHPSEATLLPVGAHPITPDAQRPMPRGKARNTWEGVLPASDIPQGMGTAPVAPAFGVDTLRRAADRLDAGRKARKAARYGDDT